MKAATVRLIAAAVAFASWIGFLIYLVVMSRDSVVLSRPQFLVSNLHVMAHVEALDSPEVVVEEVVWPETERDKLTDKSIKVINLKDCEGWTGPGTYVLPLLSQGASYRVTPTPRSPGFDPNVKGYTPLIYPATPAARRQLAEMPKLGE